MLNTRKILYWAVAALCCGLLPAGCVKENQPSPGERHNVAVQLNVGTRAIDETNGTPDDKESAIKTLRVYAFVGGQLAGHYFIDKVETQPHSFFMDLTFYSYQQEVNFYAVANEAAMTTSGPGGPQPLSENTSESELKKFSFTDKFDDELSKGLPMYYEGKQTLDFTKIKTETPTDPDHSGHSLLDYDIELTLQRPVGKLGVFAAKPEGETDALKITGLTMLESGTRTRNYLMPQTDETLKDLSNIPGDIHISVIEGEVTATLAADADKKNPANYTPVQASPYYPFENPWGSDSWNTPGDKDGNVLKIDYSYNGDQRTGLVYLPKIERNKYYAVCCLMHNEGKITVEYTVADWDDEPEYGLEFNYPSYDNPIKPLGVTDPLPEGEMYPQPTVWYNPASETDPTITEGSYAFEFKITGPEGQQWTPTISNTIDFEVKVFKEGKEIQSNECVSSPDPYVIRIYAKSNVSNKTTNFGISYTPAWATDEPSFLLINGLTNDLKWEGSQYAELIVIKQTDRPTEPQN